MIKLSAFVVIGLVGLCSAASAACPTSVPGTSGEAIRANADRLLCLQEEVDQDTRRRQIELELRANRDALNDLRLQRRFDMLPKYIPPPTFVQPPPFVPH
jgi:hypothetical protein